MRVAISAGDFAGIEGEFIERRQGGKAVVHLGAAVYLEIHEYWLVAVDRK